MEQKKSKLNIITLIISSIALVFTIVIGTLFFVNMGKQNKVTDNQYKMYIGTNDKDTNLPMPEDEAKAKVDSICLTYFSNGFTLFEATGAWKDNNVVVHEYSLVCYIVGTTIEIVHRAADDLLVQLNQSSILIETYSSPVEFYRGN